MAATHKSRDAKIKDQYQEPDDGVPIKVRSIGHLKRPSVLSTLEWVIRYLRAPDSKIPPVDEKNRERINMLWHYREWPEEQVNLFRRYEDLLHKAEMLKRKRMHGQPTKREMSEELASRCIKEFLTKAVEAGVAKIPGDAQTFEEAERNGVADAG